jgi:hypothetical protein
MIFANEMIPNHSRRDYASQGLTIRLHMLSISRGRLNSSMAAFKQGGGDYSAGDTPGLFVGEAGECTN